MVLPSYCNATTDLSRAYGKIHDFYRGQKEIKGYKAYTTENIYLLRKTGYIESLFEDGQKMTAVASIALITAALKFYWDATNDILYFWATGGVPDNHTYLAGSDWVTVKSDCIAIASRDAEAILSAKFQVPIPMTPFGNATYPYDRDFIHAVAKRACGHIIARQEPPEVDVNGTPQNTSARLLAEGEAMYVEYKDGKRRFSWELTEVEIGQGKLIPDSANTSAGMIQLRGEYVPDFATPQVAGLTITSMHADPFWKIKISTGGALGTAYFQLSTDNGTTYGTAVQTTNQWTVLSNNIWVRFLARVDGAGDFIVNNLWQIQLTSPDRRPSRSQIRFIPVA